MKTYAKLSISAIAICLAGTGLLAGCTPKPKPDPRILGDEQAKALADLGTKQFGIQWTAPPKGANEKGVVAVTDGVTTLTTHTGQRVFIVHNRKEFPPTDETAFKGTDEELKSIGLKFLTASGAAADEIADVQVLQQFTQLAEKSADGKSVRLDAPQKSHRMLMVTRRVGGVEAPASRLLLHVNGTGHVTFMELNWPDISPEVRERAALLRRAVEARYAAPQMEGGEVESVQPVVLNSPAVGFYNDSVAAIRVVYSNNSKQVGQKAVRYVDERGADIAMPRDIDRPQEKAVAARKGAATAN